ncbi:MAG: SelB C-terminal domain-containing protein [Acidobacteria bacterium]|nr:SelB C-terminal domain-containing protein [Acidobacteriota bacterium]
MAATGLDAAVGERMLKLMVREKALVRLGDLVFHADALARLKSDVRAKKASGEARLDVALFKEHYGISRKFAIPLLEYLDRERLTRRVGDARVIL